MEWVVSIPRVPWLKSAAPVESYCMIRAHMKDACRCTQCNASVSSMRAYAYHRQSGAATWTRGEDEEVQLVVDDAASDLEWL